MPVALFVVVVTALLIELELVRFEWWGRSVVGDLVDLGDLADPAGRLAAGVIVTLNPLGREQLTGMAKL